MFEDWSVDVDQVPDDDEPAGETKGHPVLPSSRHRQLLMVLDGQASDRSGRRIVFGRQDRLAARLGISRRRLQQLVADLRTPERDPRHPRTPPAGLRLGLLRVEPSRRKQPAGDTRYGVNVYVLLFAQGAPAQMGVQSALAKRPVSAGQSKAHPDPSALHNKEEQVQPVREGGLGKAPRARENWQKVADAVAETTGRDYLDVGNQQPLVLLGYDPSKAEILATLEAGLGPVQVLAEWPNDELPPRSVRRWRTAEEAPRRRRKGGRRGRG